VLVGGRDLRRHAALEKTAEAKRGNYKSHQPSPDTGNMVKRLAEREVSPYSKRQKVLASPPDQSQNKVPAAIGSGRDLKRLLAFSQDGGPQLRQNVQKFKAFLDPIAYGDDHEVQSAGRKILLEYLQSQSGDQSGNDTVCLSDLTQSWSFAAQTNNENLFSAIAAVLALFLKTTSSSLEFRDFGNQLCRNLLQEDQLKLFDRGLSANKVKEHVISPCLRLLTEMVSYDGGTAAKTVWRCREITFKRLDAFLSMRKDYLDNSNDAKRRPSVRNNALRYLFVNLRLQAPTAKAGLLTLAQGKVARNVFQDLKQDPPSILIELLSVFRKEVLSDDELPKHIKLALFREGTLLRVASLYNYRDPDVLPESGPTVQEATHSFLLYICTSPTAVIHELPLDLPPQRGDIADPSVQINGNHLMEGSLLPGNAKHAWVKTNTVASFLQGLRPHANLLEKDLILAAFQASPNLLADYFQKKQAFTYEPKLSATWVGYSMFLISTIRLPISDVYLGVQKSAQVAGTAALGAMIESIFPSSLTQKSLTKCLNQSVALITFFALKLLIALFEKLQNLLNKLQHLGAEQHGPSPESTSSRLIASFFTRCPEMRHVIAGFRSCPKANALQREAYTRLLAFYYHVIPQSALQEKFDASIPLSEALMEYGHMSTAKNITQRLELEHLLEIAKFSPDMQWWHKSGTLWEKSIIDYPLTSPDRMPLSSFSTILRMHVQSPGSAQNDPIRSLLRSTVEENHILECNEQIPSFNILLYSLQKSESRELSNEVYSFLDDCILNCSRKSVIYHEYRTNLRVQLRVVSTETTGCHVDLLMIAILSQWSFFTKAAAPSAILGVARWLATFLEVSSQAGRDRELLEAICGHLNEATDDNHSCAVLKQARNSLCTSTSTEKAAQLHKAMEQGKERAHTYEISDEEAEQQDYPLPEAPPEENDDHKVLMQWSREPIPEVILEGTLRELILCLCSEHWDIRKQALNSLCTFRESVKVSNIRSTLARHAD